jgi:hypothetical protein
MRLVDRLTYVDKIFDLYQSIRRKNKWAIEVIARDVTKSDKDPLEIMVIFKAGDYAIEQLLPQEIIMRSAKYQHELRALYMAQELEKAWTKNLSPLVSGQ